MTLYRNSFIALVRFHSFFIYYFLASKSKHKSYAHSPVSNFSTESVLFVACFMFLFLFSTKQKWKHRKIMERISFFLSYQNDFVNVIYYLLDIKLYLHINDLEKSHRMIYLTVRLSRNEMIFVLAILIRELNMFKDWTNRDDFSWFLFNLCR